MRDIGHQVICHAIRIFPYTPAFVCSYWIKITNNAVTILLLLSDTLALHDFTKKAKKKKQKIFTENKKSPNVYLFPYTTQKELTVWKSIGRETRIWQCLSILPMEDFECSLIDCRNYMLITKSLFKIFVAAQLDQWESYGAMEEKLRAHSKLRKELDITGISGSQLSRRINSLPTERVQKLFVKVVQKVEELT